MTLDDFGKGPLRPKNELSPELQQYADRNRRIRQVAFELGGDDYEYEIASEIVDHIAGLRDKYPDFEQYGAYHAVGGSGHANTDKNKPDFPGEDSIDRLLTKLEEKLSIKRQEGS